MAWRQGGGCRPGPTGCQNRPMPVPPTLVLTVEPPTGAAYDLVLLAHVLSVLVGLGSVVVAGGFALVLGRSGAGSESVRRYYRPGVNWAGRVLFLVPVFGVSLVLMSHGAWSFGDGWITIGLALWAVVAVGAEMALWPAERDLQEAVADGAGAADVRARCHAVAAMAALGFVLVVVASAVMVAKP